jgi:hypothetical protein
MVARSLQWPIENWACIFVALIYDQSQARTRNAENTHARTHSNTPLNVAEPSAFINLSLSTLSLAWAVALSQTII